MGHGKCIIWTIIEVYLNNFSVMVSSIAEKRDKPFTHDSGFSIERLKQKIVQLFSKQTKIISFWKKTKLRLHRTHYKITGRGRGCERMGWKTTMIYVCIMWHGHVTSEAQGFAGQAQGVMYYSVSYGGTIAHRAQLPAPHISQSPEPNFLWTLSPLENPLSDLELNWSAGPNPQ